MVYGNTLDASNNTVSEVLLSETDNLGLKTDFNYDSARRVAKTTEHATTTSATSTVVTVYGYTYSGGSETVTSSVSEGTGVLVSTTRSTFDASNRLVSTNTKDSAGVVLASTAYAYYSSGELKQSTDGRNHTTVHAYDGRGLETSVTAASDVTNIAQTTTTSYFPDGSVQTVTGPDQNPITFFYDPVAHKSWKRISGVATTTGNIADEIVETIADPVGRVTQQTDRLTGAVTQHGYDRQDRRLYDTIKSVALGGSDNTTADLTTTYTFDAVGNQLQQSSPGRAPVVNDYDALNRVSRTEVLGFAGAIVDVAYQFRPAANPVGYVQTITEHRFTPPPIGPASKEDFLTVNTYDEFGRITKTIDAGPESVINNKTTTHVYSNIGLTDTQTDRNGLVTTIKSDALGQTREIDRPDGSIQTFDYDANGNQIDALIKSSIGTVLQHTGFAYDALNRSTITTYFTPSGTVDSTSSTLYDFVLRQTVVTSINRDGGASLVAYDSVGHMVTTTQPNGSIDAETKYSYEYNAALGTVRITQSVFKDHATSTTFPSQTVTNVLGNTLSAIDPAGRATDSVYLPTGQLSYVTTDLNRTSYKYDSTLGQINEIYHTLTSDSLFPPTARTALVQFDSAGNRISLTNNANDVTTWTYDGLGRVVDEATYVAAQSQPGSTTGTQLVHRTWSYAGLQTTFTDRDGRKIVTTVDPVNRTSTERWYDAGSTTIAKTIVSTFDLLGQLLSVNDYGTGNPASASPISSVRYTPDPLGRQTTEVQEFTFAGVNSPSTQIVRQHLSPDGTGFGKTIETVSIDPTRSSSKLFSTTTSTTDRAGRVTGIQQDLNQNEGVLWQGSVVAVDKAVTITYWDNGQRKSLARTQGASATSAGYTSYDTTFNATARTQTNTISNKRSNGGINISSFIGTTDGKERLASSIVQLTDSSSTGNTLPGQSLIYKYDTRGGVNEVTTSTGTVVSNYNYNASGNRSDQDIKPGNRMMSNGSGNQYQYNLEGRLVAENFFIAGIPTPYTISYSWDQRGRLTGTTVKAPGGLNVSQTTYAYDGLDRRVGMTQVLYNNDAGNTARSTKSTGYAYDGTSRLLEMDLTDSGKVNRSNFLGTQPDEILATDLTIPISGTPTPTVWMFTDLTGTVSSLGIVNISGVWQIQHRKVGANGEYDASTNLGDTTAIFNSVPVMWHGGELQSQVVYSTSYPVPSFYDLGNRWYNSDTSRFLSEGNVTPNQPNVYSLNGNDPINRSAGIDWSELAGDNPEGLTWGDQAARFSTGIADVVTFGGVGYVQSRAFGNELYDVYHSGTAYYLGTAVGVVGSIGLGALSVPATVGRVAYVGRAAYVARGVQAWAVAGDVVGVAQSTYNLATGQFSPLDTLGFLPTIGWAGAASRKLAPRTAAILGQRPSVSQWQLNSGGVLRSEEDIADILSRSGIRVPKDVSIIVGESEAFYGTIDDVFAGRGALTAKLPSLTEDNRGLVYFNDLKNKFGKIPLQINPAMMQSDEAIAAVVQHELYELSLFRSAFIEGGGRMTFDAFRNEAMAGNPGNFHSQAWDAADALIKRLRGE